MEEKKLITRKEVARMLRCSYMTVIRLEKKGELTPIKIGGKVLYDYKEILDFIDKKKQRR